MPPVLCSKCSTEQQHMRVVNTPSLTSAYAEVKDGVFIFTSSPCSERTCFDIFVPRSEQGEGLSGAVVILKPEPILLRRPRLP